MVDLLLSHALSQLKINLKHRILQSSGGVLTLKQFSGLAACGILHTDRQREIARVWWTGAFR